MVPRSRLVGGLLLLLCSACATTSSRPTSSPSTVTIAATPPAQSAGESDQTDTRADRCRSELAWTIDELDLEDRHPAPATPTEGAAAVRRIDETLERWRRVSTRIADDAVRSNASAYVAELRNYRSVIAAVTFVDPNAKDSALLDAKVSAARNAALAEAVDYGMVNARTAWLPESYRFVTTQADALRRTCTPSHSDSRIE